MTTESDAIEKAADESKADVRIAQGLQALKHVRSRRSIRHFTGKRIPDEHLELILEAARHAPSPENMLSIRLVVIRDDQEMKEFLADIAQENAQKVFGSSPFELTSGQADEIGM
jgi:nitroreductase